MTSAEFLSKEKIKRILLLVFLIILMFSAIQNIAYIAGFIKKIIDLIFPFIVGACMAFVINIPLRKIENGLFKKKPDFKGKRLISYLISLILIIGIFVLALFVIIPELAATLKQLINEIPPFAERVQKSAMGLLKKYPEIKKFTANLELNTMDIVNKLLSFAKNSSGIVSSTMSVVSSVASGLFTFFVGFSFSVYAVFCKEKLLRQSKKIMYALFRKGHVEKILEVCELTNRTFSNFITGQCLEACILGTMFFITMSIFGMPYALLIAVLVTITALIPVFGAFIACFAGAVLMLTQSPKQAIFFVIMFLVLQQLEGNLIYPHVVGNSVGLPSIWVLVAVTVGGSLMGVAGMFIFIPLCSVLYALFRKFVNQRLEQRELGEEIFKATAVEAEVKKE